MYVLLLLYNTVYTKVKWHPHPSFEKKLLFSPYLIFFFFSAGAYALMSEVGSRHLA